MVKVVLLGTGAALHPWRGHSSVLITSGEERLLVDAGCTVPHSLARISVNPASIVDVVVTHGHADHYCGLTHIAFMKTFTGVPELRVYTTRHASRIIERLLESIHKPDKINASITVIEPLREYNIAGYTVKPLGALHSVEAVSLEVVASGRRILISGDTEPTPGYKARAQGADLAVHEASLPEPMPGSGHTSVRDALKQVEGARMGLLYHLTPDSEAELTKLGANPPVDGYTVKL